MYSVGLPAKSGVAGLLYVVIPGIGGIATRSNKLDQIGNSYRGVRFMQKLVQKVNIHLFDQCFDNEIISKVSLRYDMKDILKFKDSKNIELESCLKLKENQLIESNERFNTLLKDKTKNDADLMSQISKLKSVLEALQNKNNNHEDTIETNYTNHSMSSLNYTSN